MLTTHLLRMTYNTKKAAIVGIFSYMIFLVSVSCANFALIMEFRTIVKLPQRKFPALDTDAHVLMLGSCFSTHIGERLTNALPENQTAICPTGVLYNPLSVNAVLRTILTGKFDAERLLFKGNDNLWHSWLHTSAYSNPTREGCLKLISESLAKAANIARQASLICLTWGTSHIFELREEGFVVGNCHREPANRFAERRLTVEEIVDDTTKTLHLLREINPKVHVVLTISPYRYAKLGMHGNNLSKAILHLSSEKLEQSHNIVQYFPSFEIVTDELRDYRFFEADMLHPSATAVEYVWERFRLWTFSQRLSEYAADHEALLRLERHRPLSAAPAVLEQLEAQQAELRATLLKKWGK